MGLAAYGQPASTNLNLPVSLINAQSAMQQPQAAGAPIHPALPAAAAAAGAAAAQHLAQYAGAPAAADSMAGYGLGGEAQGYGGYGGAGGLANGFGSQPAPQETPSGIGPNARASLAAQAQPGTAQNYGVRPGPAGQTSYEQQPAVILPPGNQLRDEFNSPSNQQKLADVGYKQPTSAAPASADAPLLAALAGLSAQSGAKLSSYEQQYLDSINASRSSIDSQYKAALADVAQREANAQKAIGLLPGQINQLYSTGTAGLGTAEHALDAGQTAAGIRGYTSAASQMAPLMQARGLDQSARIADVPLLNIGAASQFSRERSNLAQDQLSAIDAANSEYRGYLNNRIGAQENAQQSDESARLNAYLQQLANPTSPTGAPPPGFTASQANSMRGSSAYAQVVGAIQGASSAADAQQRVAAVLAGMTNANEGPALRDYLNQIVNLATHDANSK